MKILQINNVFPTGSTGKITADIHAELQKQGVTSIVCHGMDVGAPQDANVYRTSGWRWAFINWHWSRVTGLMYGGSPISTRKIFRIIKKEKPNVVHLQCVNGYFVNIYKLISWLKKYRVKTVVTLHAEFMYTANCGHAMDCKKWLTGCGNCPRLKEETSSLFYDRTAVSWQRMKQAFEGFERDCVIAAVSPWLMERAKQSPILKSFDHYVVLNGLDTNIFRPRDSAALRKSFGIYNEKIIFHATANFSNRVDDLKGGRYILQLAHQLQEKNIKIFVAGKYEQGLVLPDNVVLLGEIKDQQLLAQYYSMADVTVITSKRETFSMVTAESLCCGTPVVGFEAGGPETIALPEYSAFVAQGDLDALEIQIRKILSQDHNRATIASAGKAIYSAENMCNGFLNLYLRMVDKINCP